MDIIVPGVRWRNRRIAASDEYLDGDERRERRLFDEGRRSPNPLPPHRPYSGRFIYGLGSRPRKASQTRPLNFDVFRYRFTRNPDQITTIVLHSTAGPAFEAANLPLPSTDTDRRSYHRVDEIITNFVVLRDGTVVYTHDVEFILSVAGGRRGIDIEFAGRFPNDVTVPRGAERLDHTAIQAGRLLIRHLKTRLPNLRYIHPHGQVQSGERGKVHSCPGPDVWVNVGEWAVTNLGLNSRDVDPDGRYPNHGISSRQSNPDYLQTL